MSEETRTRTRKPSYLVAMESVESAVDGQPLIVVVDPEAKITTMAEMKKYVKDNAMVGRKLLILRDIGEIIELKEQTKLVF
jgi:hypothetical protein